MQITYRVEHDDKSDGFIAYCPVMKPVSIYAKTRDEVAPKIRDAIELYLQKHPEFQDKLQTETIEM
ncbi:HicB family protein [Nitrosopumilus oxyclinae]|uniref:HicB family protein n=1 Tax=Nitrosopumilus oxyclinae TaxID=1959104 RepID=A0A7D5M178_9ARCH|nr:type II toxin-antitoxin system HicB family antitoxin [Nitrosopumilus oxyclinae]QLH04112.1 HicB family protein [Nitrosopumilus oxyclinae]